MHPLHNPHPQPRPQLQTLGCDVKGRRPVLPRGAFGGRGIKRGAGLGVGGEQVLTYRLETGGETETERQAEAETKLG